MMTVAETFDRMLANFNPTKAIGINKILQWNIDGNETGKWAFHIHDQACELILGGVDKPDIVFHASTEDWLALSEGKLDAMTAFMAGKIKMAGDMSLAMKVRSLFPEQRRSS